MGLTNIKKTKGIDVKKRRLLAYFSGIIVFLPAFERYLVDVKGRKEQSASDLNRLIHLRSEYKTKPSAMAENETQDELLNNENL